MDVLSACMSVPHMLVWYPHRPEESIVFLTAGVIDGSRLPCGCWELNPSPLKDQPMLLTAGLYLSSLSYRF